MNKKIISIASIIFAVIFVGIFIVVWGNTRSIIKQESDALNTVYATQYDFDISVFDNRVVTVDTIENLISNISQSGYSQSVKLKFYKYNGAGTEPTLIGVEDNYKDYSSIISIVQGTIGTIDANGNNQIRTSLSVTNTNGVVDGILLSDDK